MSSSFALCWIFLKVWIPAGFGPFFLGIAFTVLGWLKIGWLVRLLFNIVNLGWLFFWLFNFSCNCVYCFLSNSTVYTFAFSMGKNGVYYLRGWNPHEKK